MKIPPKLKDAAVWLVIAVILPALILWILALVFQPFGDFVTRLYKRITGGEPYYRNSIATAVPGCITGFVPRLLAPEGGSIPATLMNGADRTYICDNAYVEGKRSEIPEKLAKAYPGCFAFTYASAPQLALTEASPAVCRALYRVDEHDRTEPTSYQQGVNVCLGARGRTFSPKVPSGQLPRTCTDDELRAEGFLQH